MRYFLIINSRAYEKNLDAIDNAISNITSINPDLRNRMEICFTRYPGHAGDAAAEASDTYGDKITIVACGGDGTVHEVTNALAFRKTPMIVIPMGTGNDFAKTVAPRGKNINIEWFLLHLDEMKVKPIDIVRVDSYDVMGNHLQNWSRYFTNIASVGVDTKVQSRAKAIVAAKDTAFNRKTAYIRSALACVFKKRTSLFKFSLELEDGNFYNSDSDQQTLISICNARYYGDGFCPAPKARIDDGLIDVCAIRDVSLPRALFLLALYRFGKHEGKNGIITHRVTSGIITSTDPSYQLMGNFDGEDFFGHRIRFEVYPKALKMGFFPGSKMLE